MVCPTRGLAVLQRWYCPAWRASTLPPPDAPLTLELTGMCQSIEPIPTTASEDQRAVAEYFASELYQQANRRVHDSSPGHARCPNDIHWGGRSEASRSFVGGLAGLATATVVLAIMFPIGMEVIENVFVQRPHFVLMTAILQTLFFPVIIGVAFATVVPMFWYGSIWLRCTTAMVLVLPSCLAFGVTFWSLQMNRSPASFISDTSVVLFSYFMTASTTSLAVQLFTPWTLCHARGSEKPLPPTGLRSLMELILLAAIGFAILMSIHAENLFWGMMFFSGLGTLASASIILLLIVFLRSPRRRSKSGTLATVLLAIAAAWMLNGFFAALEFGRDALWNEFFLIMATSVYGAVIICSTMAMYLWWLRSWGWQCVDRRSRPSSTGLNQRNDAIS